MADHLLRCHEREAAVILLCWEPCDSRLSRHLVPAHRSAARWLVLQGAYFVNPFKRVNERLSDESSANTP
jgi:hypothetical protein